MTEKNKFWLSDKGKIVGHEVNGILLGPKGEIVAREIVGSNRTIDGKGSILGIGDQKLKQLKK